MKKLRDVMKKRSDARATIIDKRLDQLLNEASGLGWSTPRGSGVSGISPSYSGSTNILPAGPTPRREDFAPPIR